VNSSILYISDSRLSFPEAESQVDAIVDWSRRWNESVGITGALIFTHQHFSHFIEGPAPAVRDLFANIRRDSRHTNIDVLQRREGSSRRFEGWSMAFSGPEMFLQRQIEPLAQRRPGIPVDKPAEELIRLMQAFSQSGTA
jgi:hypothetical protein